MGDQKLETGLDGEGRRAFMRRLLNDYAADDWSDL